MEPFLGEIRMFAGDYAPEGWALCNGQSLSIAGNETLYSVIGSLYGGDSTTFKLPNLMGRSVLGAGQGTGLKNYPMASSGGEVNVLLSLSTIPNHGHGFNVANVAATTTTPGPDVTFGNVDDKLSFYIDTSQPTSGVIDFSPAAVASTGGYSSHPNIMPSTIINYIICTTGIYPTTSD